MYKVIHSVDHLDNDPTIKIFEFHHDMEEWVQNSVAQTMQGLHRISKNVYRSQKEMEELQAIEFSLIKIEEV
tara:strand:- start:49 stop:264 length:216 start_codon:yes stop_codon:yes gene_type:complete